MTSATIRIYGDKRMEHVVGEKNLRGTSPDFYVEYFSYSDIKESLKEIPEKLAKYTRQVTAKVYMWEGDGNRLIVGKYISDGVNVEITKKMDTRGSGPTRQKDCQFSVFGTFKTLELLEEFMDALIYKGLAPTQPRCPYLPSSEQEYGKRGMEFVKAAAAMKKTTRDYTRVVSQQNMELEEMRTMIAQLQHHVNYQASQLQRLMTPQNAV